MTQHITLLAPDISCAHCVATVQKTLGALPGVDRVVADVDTKKIEITFDPARTSIAQISEALDFAGYPSEAAE